MRNRDDAIRLAQDAGRASAQSRISEGPRTRTSDEAEELLAGLKNNPEDVGDIPGEEILGRQFALECFRNAEIDEVRLCAEGLRAAEDYNAEESYYDDKERV